MSALDDALAYAAGLRDDGSDDTPREGYMSDTIRVLAAEVHQLRAQRAAVIALIDETERRAQDMVGMFSGKPGADVPHWVGRLRAAVDYR